jgi:hypothetical protein
MLIAQISDTHVKPEGQVACRHVDLARTPSAKAASSSTDTAEQVAGPAQQDPVDDDVDDRDDDERHEARGDDRAVFTATCDADSARS